MRTASLIARNCNGIYLSLIACNPMTTTCSKSNISNFKWESSIKAVAPVTGNGQIVTFPCTMSCCLRRLYYEFVASSIFVCIKWDTKTCLAELARLKKHDWTYKCLYMRRRSTFRDMEASMCWSIAIPSAKAMTRPWNENCWLFRC